MISHDLFSVLLELVVTSDDRKIKLKNIVQMARGLGWQVVPDLFIEKQYYLLLNKNILLIINK